jgi:hypothetical protein
MLDAFLKMVFENIVWLFPLGLVAMCFFGIWWISRKPDNRTYNAYGPIPQGNEVWAANVQKKLAARAKAQAEQDEKTKKQKVSLDRQWAAEEKRRKA